MAPTPTAAEATTAMEATAATAHPTTTTQDGPVESRGADPVAMAAWGEETTSPDRRPDRAPTDRADQAAMEA
jgi:hypothetical protein